MTKKRIILVTRVSLGGSIFYWSHLCSELTAAECTEAASGEIG